MDDGCLSGLSLQCATGDPSPDRLTDRRLGRAQFAFVGVSAAGGSPKAGAGAGLLLNPRLAAFGLMVAPLGALVGAGLDPEAFGLDMAFPATS